MHDNGRPRWKGYTLVDQSDDMDESRQFCDEELRTCIPNYEEHQNTSVFPNVPYIVNTRSGGRYIWGGAVEERSIDLSRRLEITSCICKRLGKLQHQCQTHYYSAATETFLSNLYLTFPFQ